MSDYRKVAIMGGTFDPVHIGHLIIAEQAHCKFNLEKVIFIPAGIPPHKDNSKVTGGKHRLAMIQLAVEDNPKFSVSDWEFRKQRDSYTVDTLKYIEKIDLAEQIYLIIGADSLFEIFTWKDPEYILGHANLIVACRPGYNLNEILKDPRYGSYRKNIHLLDNIKMKIASSTIREMVSKGHSIRYLVLPRVQDYIMNNNLYRGD